MNNNDYSKYLNQLSLKSEPKQKNNSYFKNLIIRLFISIILFLIGAIVIKSSLSSKNTIYQNLYEKHFSFTSIKKFYNQYLGGIIPLDKLVPSQITTPVFNENLVYAKAEKYLDGVKLTTEENYLVPVLESGIVVYLGPKELYGNTVIIQGMDGVEIWYSNLNNLNVELYDYVEEKTLLGEVQNNYLYLVYSQNGQILNYEEYLS